MKVGGGASRATPGSRTHKWCSMHGTHVFVYFLFLCFFRIGFSWMCSRLRLQLLPRRHYGVWCSPAPGLLRRAATAYQGRSGVRWASTGRAPCLGQLPNNRQARSWQACKSCCTVAATRLVQGGGTCRRTRLCAVQQGAYVLPLCNVLAVFVFFSLISFHLLLLLPTLYCPGRNAVHACASSAADSRAVGWNECVYIWIPEAALRPLGLGAHSSSGSSCTSPVGCMAACTPLSCQIGTINRCGADYQVFY